MALSNRHMRASHRCPATRPFGRPAPISGQSRAPWLALGGLLLGFPMIPTDAEAACVLGGSPALTTITCTGTFTQPTSLPVTLPNSLAVTVGDNNPADVTISSGALVSATMTGPAGTFVSVDTGPAAAPSSITAGGDAVNLTSSNGASILIGQGISPGAGAGGLNANVTSQTGNGIIATAAGAGPISITTAPGTTISGAKSGINASVVDGAASIIFNGNVTTTTPGSFYDVSATSTGAGSITIGGSGNATSGGILATSSGLGGITIGGSGNTTDSLASAGIFAQISNPANTADIQIARGGFITGATNGIFASTAGSGNILLTTAGAVTGNGGYGINTSVAGGTATINIGSGSAVSGTTGALSVASSGAGSTIINNNGLISGNIASIGTTTLNNAGTVSLVNGVTTDTLTLSNLVGKGGTIAIDVNAATKASDQIVITNSLSGSTAILVSPVGGAAYITTPIKILTSATPSAAVFTSANSGPINYSITTPDNQNYYVVSSLNTSVASAAPTNIGAVITALNTGFFQNASAFINEPANPEKNQINGGPWIRIATGRNDISSTTSAANPTTGVAYSQTKVRTQFSGFQTGIDLGVANVQGTGWNTHIGVTAGQVDLGTNDLNTTNVTSQVQIPFVGLYTAVTGHNFFADAQIREDFYDIKLTNPSGFIFGKNLSGTAFSANTSAGYKFDLGSNWFIEPSGAFMYSDLHVDSLLTPLDVTQTSFGSLNFQPFKSMLGRLGVRAGTTYVIERMELVLQPFVTASVWREFAGNSKTNFVTTNAVVPLSVSRIGTFGQVGLGVSGQVLKTGFVGFVRGDYRFGDNINGYALVAGLRYGF